MTYAESIACSLRYQFVGGDTELLPGLDLIETSGHVPGHHAVLVDLPQSGPILLAIDAVALQAHFTATRPAGPTDADGEEVWRTRKGLHEHVDTLPEHEEVPLEAA